MNNYIVLIKLNGLNGLPWSMKYIKCAYHFQNIKQKKRSEPRKWKTHAMQPIIAFDVDAFAFWNGNFATFEIKCKTYINAEVAD